MMKISPAEAAIEAAELAVETHEMPQLVRLIARRLPADREAVREALCEVRRKGWLQNPLDRFILAKLEAINEALLLDLRPPSIFSAARLKVPDDIQSACCRRNCRRIPRPRTSHAC